MPAPPIDVPFGMVSFGRGILCNVCRVRHTKRWCLKDNVRPNAANISSVPTWRQWTVPICFDRAATTINILALACRA